MLKHHLLVEVEPLLGPVLPGVLVGEPEEDGAVDGDRLHEDQRPVQRDQDHVRLAPEARHRHRGAALALKE